MLLAVKLTGKLLDGTVFSRKGHDDELFEFKTDEGKTSREILFLSFPVYWLLGFFCDNGFFVFLTEQVIDGLDRAVLTMKKGEVAHLTIAPEYAFGSSESQQELAVVPANSTVYYEVDLVSFEKEKESWDMSTQEKIEAAGKKKEEGNVLFKAGKYARASKRYEKVSFLRNLLTYGLQIDLCNASGM